MAGVFCTACGENIPADVAYCSRCGTPNRVQVPGPPATAATLAPPRVGHFSPPMVASPRMGFGEAIGSFFRNYATFDGRARRSEFWFAQLFLTLTGLGFQVLLFIPIVELIVVAFIGWLVWAVAVLVPSLAIASRRLHDTDTSFGYYFLILIPLVGPILVLIKFAEDGTRGPNRFGDSVKYSAQASQL